MLNEDEQKLRDGINSSKLQLLIGPLIFSYVHGLRRNVTNYFLMQIALTTRVLGIYICVVAAKYFFGKRIWSPYDGKKYFAFLRRLSRRSLSRLLVEPNASTLLDIEELDIASVVAIAPDPGNNPDPLDVLAAVADDDRNSSGGEEEDISERDIPENKRQTVADALRKDIMRFFPQVQLITKKKEYAMDLASGMGVTQRQMRKWRFYP